MSDINKLIIMGRFVHDASLKQSASGINIANFSIACNEYKKDGADDVSFFNCVAFDKLAETISKYFKKGSRILLDGQLKQERWQDKEGKNKDKTVIIVNKIFFVDSSKKSDDTIDSAPDTNSNKPREGLPEDTIPF